MNALWILPPIAGAIVWWAWGALGFEDRYQAMIRAEASRRAIAMGMVPRWLTKDAAPPEQR